VLLDCMNFESALVDYMTMGMFFVTVDLEWKIEFSFALLGIYCMDEIQLRG
jgi:hypothetical protein